MKRTRVYKYLLISLISMGVFGLSTSIASADTEKTVTIHYKNTAGKKVHADRSLSTSGAELSAYGSQFALNGIGQFGGPKTTGYVMRIKGYVPAKLKKDLTYNNLPSSVTLRYVKIKTLNEKVRSSYMRQFNAYRKTHHRIALKAKRDLQKKANVRAKELWVQDTHVRPNGQSYNKRGSGYAETMAELPAVYSHAGVTQMGYGAQLVYTKNGTLSYKQTAKTVVKELMTIDKIHRNTELSTWSKYSAAAFSFSSDGSAMMVQLFHY